MEMTTKEGTPIEPQEPTSSPPPGGDSAPEPVVTEPEPVADPFAGTRFEGRSPEEAAAYVKLLEDTVQEQSTKLTEVQSAPPPAPAEPKEEVDFFSNPRTVIRQELEEMVKPLNDQLSEFKLQNQVNSAWEQARVAIPDFKDYEQYVQQILVGQNIHPSNVTVELLKSLYYTAVGYVARHGGSPPSEGQMGHPQSQSQRQVPPVSVPQHRPSSAPLPTPQGDEPPKLRTLTENEARLAREWGMSHEEYLAYQSADAEEVLTKDFGGDNG